MLEKIPSDTGAGLRDRALLLLGCSSGRLRAELAGLDVEDLRKVPEGYRLTIRRYKTDQEGKGHEIGIPYCQHSETRPTIAMNAYLKAGGLEIGPHFRPATATATCATVAKARTSSRGSGGCRRSRSRARD